MAITQKITTFPPAPDSATDTPQEFNVKANAFVNHQSQSYVGEVNTWATQANNTKDEINQIVASLPTGTINDAVATTTNTYSAVKIESIVVNVSKDYTWTGSHTFNAAVKTNQIRSIAGSTFNVEELSTLGGKGSTVVDATSKHQNNVWVQPYNTLKPCQVLVELSNIKADDTIGENLACWYKVKDEAGTQMEGRVIERTLPTVYVSQRSYYFIVPAGGSYLVAIDIPDSYGRVTKITEMQ